MICVLSTGIMLLNVSCINDLEEQTAVQIVVRGAK